MKNNSFLFTTGLMSAALALCFAVAAEAGQKTNSYIPFASGSRSFVKSPSAKDRAKLVKMTGSIGGDWTVSYSPVTGRPESIMGGRSTKKYTGTAREGAGKFLSENAYALQIDTSSLKTDISRNFMTVGIGVEYDDASIDFASSLGGDVYNPLEISFSYRFSGLGRTYEKKNNFKSSEESGPVAAPVGAPNNYKTKDDIKDFSKTKRVIEEKKEDSGKSDGSGENKFLFRY